MNAEHASALRNFLALCREAGIYPNTARYLWAGIRDEVLPGLAAGALEGRAMEEYAIAHAGEDFAEQDGRVATESELTNESPPKAARWFHCADNEDGTCTITNDCGEPDCGIHTAVIACQFKALNIVVLGRTPADVDRLRDSLTVIPNTPADLT